MSEYLIAAPWILFGCACIGWCVTQAFREQAENELKLSESTVRHLKARCDLYDESVQNGRLVPIWELEFMDSSFGTEAEKAAEELHKGKAQ